MTASLTTASFVKIKKRRREEAKNKQIILKSYTVKLKTGEISWHAPI